MIGLAFSMTVSPNFVSFIPLMSRIFNFGKSSICNKVYKLIKKAQTCYHIHLRLCTALYTYGEAYADGVAPMV